MSLSPSWYATAVIGLIFMSGILAAGAGLVGYRSGYQDGERSVEPMPSPVVFMAGLLYGVILSGFLLFAAQLWTAFFAKQ